MTIDRMKELWPLAKVLHEARRDIAWGKKTLREPWPEFTISYSHNPIAYIDLALEQADAASRYFSQS